MPVASCKQTTATVGDTDFTIVDLRYMMCLSVEDEISLGSDDEIAELLHSMNEARRRCKQAEVESVANPALAALAMLSRDETTRKVNRRVREKQGEEELMARPSLKQAIAASIRNKKPFGVKGDDDDDDLSTRVPSEPVHQPPAPSDDAWDSSLGVHVYSDVNYQLA